MLVLFVFTYFMLVSYWSLHICVELSCMSSVVLSFICMHLSRLNKSYTYLHVFTLLDTVCTKYFPTQLV